MKRINVRGFLDVDHARLIVTAIERCAGSAIDLRIDSPGGQYGAAVVICLAIEEHARPVTTTVVGEGCSAAFLVAIAGDVRRIDKGGVMMTHCASPPSPVNASEVRKAVHELTGQPIERIANWMAREKYFNADDALEAGLVDRIIDANAPEVVRLHEPKKRAPTLWLREWRELVEQFDLRHSFEPVA